MNTIVRRALIITYLVLVVFAFGLGMLAGLYHYYSDSLPPLSELEHFDLKEGSKVFDRHDRLIHTFAVEHRTMMSLREISPWVADAALSGEDARFYTHWGRDLTRVVRAVMEDAVTLNFSQGASTITQQLARNLFLTFDKQLARKIKEQMLAVQIEKLYSKDEILELYLNKVPFGPGLYGVETAARVYFSKSASDLTLPESALIAGIAQRPYALDPRRFPERSVRRRNVVLHSMLNNGKITRQQYDEAVATPLELHSRDSIGDAADYFIEYIRTYLEGKYGTTALFAGGLNIYTTMDLDLTAYADTALNKHLADFEKSHNYSHTYADVPADASDIKTQYVQGGVLLMDAQNGEVLVMIGGRDFSHSKFNRITQATRQPGSSFKPIVYATALECGYTPATVILDEPLTFVQDGRVFWTPHNYTYEYIGYLRMRDAIKQSINTYAIKMIADIGPSKVVEKARQFGITTKLKPFYSMAVGAADVRPIELISGYSAFANGGTRATPVFIRRVEDAEGNVLEQPHTRRVRVTDEKVAYLMANMMESVLEPGGTGAGVRSRGYRWPAAGKTGTTDDYRDAWFIGYNHALVCGVWVGFDDFHSMGRGGAGSSAAMPPWPAIMNRAVASYSREKGHGAIDGSSLDFAMPQGVVGVNISARTGLLPESGLDDTIYEYFISGTEPTPLSDSLNYNFYPTRYRQDPRPLVFDLDHHPGGYRIEQHYPNARIVRPAP